jgi:cell division septal protein FtsQ
VKSPRYFKKIDPNTKVLIKQIFVGMIAISTAVLLLTAIWYGTRAQRLTIVEVVVEGGETINHEEVRVLAQTELDGQYAGFIPRRFAWFYSKNDITKAVSQVERIDSVEVSRIDGKTVLVSFDEFLPDSLWCRSLTENECVFLDKTGYAYAQSPALMGGSFLRFVHLSNEPEVARSLVEEGDYQLLNQLADLLSQENWQISHIEIDSARDAFLHVVDGGEFKVTLTQEPTETVDNLMVVLTSPDFEDVKPGTFQYIDLRFGNKVFVNEEALVEAVATSTLGVNTEVVLEEVAQEEEIPVTVEEEPIESVEGATTTLEAESE